MDQGLFRTELSAITSRYGYLLWRRSRLCVDSPEFAHRLFELTLQAVAETGAALRGREAKLEWLYGVLDRIVADEVGRRAGVTPAVAGDVRLEAWHAGDPDPDARMRSESSSEAKALLAELDRARREFAEEMDIPALLDRVFIDEPLPVLDGSRRTRRLRVMAAVGFVAVLALLWPRQEDLGPVPREFSITALVRRGEEERRESSTRVVLQGGDQVQVELAIPKPQTVSVYVLEKSGELTELAVGRLFRPGVWVLPQILHIDAKKALDARLIAGSPALVRTATSTGRFEAVFSLELVSSVEPKR